MFENQLKRAIPSQRWIVSCKMISSAWFSFFSSLMLVRECASHSKNYKLRQIHRLWKISPAWQRTQRFCLCGHRRWWNQVCFRTMILLQAANLIALLSRPRLRLYRRRTDPKLRKSSPSSTTIIKLTVVAAKRISLTSPPLIVALTVANRNPRTRYRALLILYRLSKALKWLKKVANFYWIFSSTAASNAKKSKRPLRLSISSYETQAATSSMWTKYLSIRCSRDVRRRNWISGRRIYSIGCNKWASSRLTLLTIRSLTSLCAVTRWAKHGDSSVSWGQTASSLTTLLSALWLKE